MGHFNHGSGNYEVQLFCFDWIWLVKEKFPSCWDVPRVFGKQLSVSLNPVKSSCIFVYPAFKTRENRFWIRLTTWRSSKQPTIDNWTCHRKLQSGTWMQHTSSEEKRERCILGIVVKTVENNIFKKEKRKKESLQSGPLWHVVPLTRTWKINDYMGKEVTWSDVGLCMWDKTHSLAVTLSSPSYYLIGKIPL